jgi:hypothetical protein
VLNITEVLARSEVKGFESKGHAERANLLIESASCLARGQLL